MHHKAVQTNHIHELPVDLSWHELPVVIFEEHIDIFVFLMRWENF